LKRHLKTFYYEEDSEGTYTDGLYVDGDITETEFEAVPMPLKGYELSLFSQGALNFDGIKIYTKYDLGNAVDKTIKRGSDLASYRLISAKPYKEIANLKIYVLKRIEGES
jgi:hypothetical protein